MERTFKQIWISRLLALLIMSVVFATLVSSALKKIGSFDYKIEVRANDTEKILRLLRILGYQTFILKPEKPQGTREIRTWLSLQLDYF